PSRGGLRLHDGLLSFAQVGQLRLPEAELAYLSACSTVNGARQQVDEPLHLASALQLAGFRHVVGSLWPLDDQIAADAAHAFYQRMPTTPTADSAAGALHAVTVDLRARYPDRPDLWASLVHSGP